MISPSCNVRPKLANDIEPKKKFKKHLKIRKITIKNGMTYSSNTKGHRIIWQKRYTLQVYSAAAVTPHVSAFHISESYMNGKTAAESSRADRKSILLDRNAKAAAQFEFLREIPGVSSTAARRVISHLRDDGQGRGTSKRKRLKFPTVSHLVTTVSFGEPSCHMAVTSVPELLQAKCQQSKFFSDMMAYIIKENGPQFDLVLAWDEATPGNVLQPDLQRKAAMTYGAIAQMPVLWADDAWMTLALVRTKDLQSVENGYQQSLVEYLRWLKRQTQHGFSLTVNEEPTLCSFSNISLVADADGLRLLTGCKGSSALKPCFLCQNVVNGHDNLQHHVHISCCDVHACKLQTAENLIQIQDYLQSLPRRKDREEAEKLLGWHHNALSASVLIQDDIRNWIPLSSLRYDAMHCFLANGIVPQELGLWYNALLDNTTCDIDAIRKYILQCWTASRESSLDVNKIFTNKRWQKDRDFRGDASEALSVLPLMVAFSWEVIVPEFAVVRPQCECLTTLCALICCWTAAKRGGDLQPKSTEMQRLQKIHLQQFASVYSIDVCRPKHHYSLHLPQQWNEHKMCVDCFPAERKHRLFKRIAQTLTKLNGFATSALLEMTHKEVSQSDSQNSFLPVLRGQVATCHELQTWFGEETYVSNSVECKGITFAAGQYKIVSAQTAVEIHGAVECSGRYFLWCQPLRPLPGSNTAMSQWKMTCTDNSWLLPLDQSLQAMPVYFFRKRCKDTETCLTFLHA